MPPLVLFGAGGQLRLASKERGRSRERVTRLTGDSMTQDVQNRAAAVVDSLAAAGAPAPAPLTSHTATNNRLNLKFNGSDKFVRELRKRVDAYFEKTGKRRRD